MTDIVSTLKTKEYAFGECSARFNEFWGTFQNIISTETTRFLGNIIQIDPGKKSKSMLHFTLFNMEFVCSYALVGNEKEYRSLLLLEKVPHEGPKEYVSHCYFDDKGNVYAKLEDSSPQHNLTEESFVVNLVHEVANMAISSSTSRAKELDQKAAG